MSSRRSAAAAALFFLFAVATFFVWGDDFERALDAEAGVAYLTRASDWAWGLACGLLVADIVLPIPTSAVIASLGVIYGPWLGGLIGAAGAALAGAVAYGLCRLLGERAAARIVGAADLAKLVRFFAGEGGAWLVATSRWMPIFPEMVACAAGLARMPVRQFAVALLCGCVPLGFGWAWVGELGRGAPTRALVVAIVAPACLCLAMHRRRTRP